MSSIKGGAETIHDNKTVAYAHSRNPTPSGEDAKRTQVYSRVTDRDKLLLGSQVTNDIFDNN